jgi:hypothetical protein
MICVEQNFEKIALAEFFRERIDVAAQKRCSRASSHCDQSVMYWVHHHIGAEARASRRLHNVIMPPPICTFYFL